MTTVSIHHRCYQWQTEREITFLVIVTLTCLAKLSDVDLIQKFYFLSHSVEANEIRNGLLNFHELLTEWVVNETADLAKQAQRETTVITLPAVCATEVLVLKIPALYIFAEHVSAHF